MPPRTGEIARIANTRSEEPSALVSPLDVSELTSDAGGIRHASIDAPDADQAWAKYMLVTCSAFVSYVIEAGRKSKLV